MSAAAQVVRAPLTPLYMRGWDQSCQVPEWRGSSVRDPGALYLRGYLGAVTSPTSTGAKVLAASGGVASAVTGSVLASMWAGTSMAAAAGPIAAGVALLVGVIAGLWAKHDARVAGAKDENTAINSAVQTFDSVLRAIFDAANSTDQSKVVSGAVAAQQCQTLMQTFWQQMAPHMSGPGRADSSNMGANCGTVNPSDPCSGVGRKCDKSCTASCCVGCNDLLPTVAQAISVFQAGAGSVKVCTVYGSKYGASQRGGYTLTYKPAPVDPVTGALESAGLGGVSPWLLLAGGAAALLAFM